ncbi:MAG: hypothetical protein JSW39_29430 [Desulfobacterales bacterium]|nr:MAG: hypothetical protein JSW39_29430 [Desulfobacterales bacterium]
MPSYKSPSFRKAVIPWYRSKKVYFLALFALLAVVVFGLVGWSVARENAAYQDYIWVPVLLVAMCCAMIIAIILRLIRRYFSK